MVGRSLLPQTLLSDFPLTSLQLLSDFSPTSLRLLSAEEAAPRVKKTTHRSIGASGLGRLLSDFSPPIFEWGMKNQYICHLGGEKLHGGEKFRDRKRVPS